MFWFKKKEEEGRHVLKLNRSEYTIGFYSPNNPFSNSVMTRDVEPQHLLKEMSSIIKSKRVIMYVKRFEVYVATHEERRVESK